MEYDNFVFYGSWRESLEGFREEFGDDYAKEALWNLMLVATAGDIETERKSIIGFINGAVMPNVNKAKDRYAAAIENGKKGGRPKTVDADKVLELKQEGMTNKQVAERLGCSVSSIEKINAENRKNQKNQKNSEITVIENQENRKNRKNQKNLNDNDNVNVNNNVNENKKENKKDIFSFSWFDEEEEENRKNQKRLNIDIDIDIEKEKEKEKEREIEKDIFSFSWFDEEEEEERKKKVAESAKQVRLAAIRKNPDNRFRDKEEQEYFDFIKGANIEKGMSETAAEEDAWQMILDDREYWDSRVKIS